jgi:predicted nuclease of predicted toxin-antitoxin system
VRLLLDEMLAPAIAWELRSHGHDVEAVGASGAREALGDEALLSFARNERRAIVTNNVRDFRALHQEAITPGGPGHYGIIFMPARYRRTKAASARIVAALETKLAESPGEGDLRDRESWL